MPRLPACYRPERDTLHRLSAQRRESSFRTTVEEEKITKSRAGPTTSSLAFRFRHFPKRGLQLAFPAETHAHTFPACWSGRAHLLRPIPALSISSLPIKLIQHSLQFNVHSYIHIFHVFIFGHIHKQFSRRIQPKTTGRLFAANAEKIQFQQLPCPQTTKILLQCVAATNRPIYCRLQLTPIHALIPVDLTDLIYPQTDTMKLNQLQSYRRSPTLELSLYLQLVLFI
ncbi:Hypothetical_protein [Hexamita inflata]|uniref:Hypothetical_protein n=1 Tax=Hexamita inflata TaxID=28002 RepID=A0ABP1HV92_9EUKA